MLSISPFAPLSTHPNGAAQSIAPSLTNGPDFGALVQTAPAASTQDAHLTRVEQLTTDLIAAETQDLDAFEPLFLTSDIAEPATVSKFLELATPQIRNWLEPLLTDGQLTRPEIMEQARIEAIESMRGVLTDFLDRNDAPAVEALREVISRGRAALSPLFFELHKLTEANEGVQAAAQTFQSRDSKDTGMSRDHDIAMAQELRGWSAELTQKIADLREMLQEQTRRKVEQAAR